MLDRCFLHISGVGPAFQAKLHEAGIVSWADALDKPLPCGPGKAGALRAAAAESLERLEQGDIRWFGTQLPPAEQWRLFPHFKNRAAYVDIETTGTWDWMEDHGGSITTIALYDGARVRTYVQGENLEDFADHILNYTLLVTWNGRRFDAPILRRALRIPLDQGHMAHLDLLPVFRGMGLKGGLKAVEKKLGLNREELDGVDGWAAVRLWRAYERTGSRATLETLLAYNVEDVLSLESLAEYAAARLGEPGVAEGAVVPPVKRERNPHVADSRIVRLLHTGSL